jgi:uncharacterized protein (DUF1778 family)
MPNDAGISVFMDNSAAPQSDRAQRYRIEIKVTEAQKALIARAAAARGEGLSEFVRAAAETTAHDVLGRA